MKKIMLVALLGLLITFVHPLFIYANGQGRSVVETYTIHGATVTSTLTCDQFGVHVDHAVQSTETNNGIVYNIGVYNNPDITSFVVYPTDKTHSPPSGTTWDAHQEGEWMFIESDGPVCSSTYVRVSFLEYPNKVYMPEVLYGSNE